MAWASVGYDACTETRLDCRRNQQLPALALAPPVNNRVRDFQMCKIVDRRWSNTTTPQVHNRSFRFRCRFFYPVLFISDENPLAVRHVGHSGIPAQLQGLCSTSTVSRVPDCCYCKYHRLETYLVILGVRVSRTVPNLVVIDNNNTRKRINFMENESCSSNWV